MTLTLSHLTHTYRRAAKPALCDVTAELTPGFRAGRVRELRIPSIGFRVVLEE